MLGEQSVPLFNMLDEGEMRKGQRNFDKGQIMITGVVKRQVL